MVFVSPGGMFLVTIEITYTLQDYETTEFEGTMKVESKIGQVIIPIKGSDGC